MKTFLRPNKKNIVVSNFIFLLRQARDFFFLFHIGLFSEEKRVLHHTDMYFNHVLKCPIDLKTKFGMGVLE